MTTDEKRAEARRLRAEGLLLREIAERLGYAHPESVKRLLREPAVHREITRRDNAKRRAAKRAWEREHDRKPCPCGAMRGTGSHRPYKDGLCADCHREVIAVGRAMREERIAEMWNRGDRVAEIALALGSTVASINRTVTVMRNSGWDVPRRKNWTPEAIEAQREAWRRRGDRAA